MDKMLHMYAQTVQKLPCSSHPVEMLHEELTLLKTLQIKLYTNAI